MILQILADAGQFVQDWYAGALQNWTSADARSFENLRRADGACRKDDLAFGAGDKRRVSLFEDNRFGAFPVETEAIDLGAGHELQIGAVENRFQKPSRSTPAPAAFLVDVEIGRAFVAASIEIACLGNAYLFGGIANRIED